MSGVNDEAIQKKLLAERELTYSSALRIAQGLETAIRDLREMQNPWAVATLTVKNKPMNNVQTRPITGHVIVVGCRDTSRISASLKGAYVTSAARQAT